MVVLFAAVSVLHLAASFVSNKKLRARAIRIIREETGCDDERAEAELLAHGGNIAEAIDTINAKN